MSPECFLEFFDKQTNPDSNLETQHEARRTAETNTRTPRSSVLNRTLPQNKDGNASVNYITTKTLKAAVATKRARTRSQQVCIAEGFFYSCNAYLLQHCKLLISASFSLLYGML